MLLVVATKGQLTEPTYKRFFKIIIIFLARQGLPFRGNWISLEDDSDGCEKESNFYQLMLLCANDDPGTLARHNET